MHATYSSSPPRYLPGHLCSCWQGYTGEKVDGTTTVVCPQHKCCMCVRNTAAAGGMLFRCVDCPKVGRRSVGPSVTAGMTGGTLPAT